MRVTEKKMAANQANAQKSTGPKTAEGKQIVSQNGVKHGLYTHALILNSPALKDDPYEFDGLISALIDDLQPEGLFENFLVRKIANCLWRSRRVIDAETAQIERQLGNVDSRVERNFELSQAFNENMDKPTPEDIEQARRIEIGTNSIPNDVVGDHIMRYEMRLDRQLSRSLRLLSQLQDRRKSNSGKEKDIGSPKMSDQTQIPRKPITDNTLKNSD